MRFQKTKFTDDNGERKLVWDASLADAATRRKTLRNMKMGSIESCDVDVPTDKVGLLNFLNENLTK